MRGTIFRFGVAFAAVLMGVDCCTEGEPVDTMDVLSDTAGWSRRVLQAGRVVGLLFRRGVRADFGAVCCR